MEEEGFTGTVKTFCFEIIIDKHAIVRNNAEIPCTFHQANGNTLHNYSTISQPGN